MEQNKYSTAPPKCCFIVVVVAFYFASMCLTNKGRSHRVEFSRNTLIEVELVQTLNINSTQSI
jgi:hypothetical protein